VAQNLTDKRGTYMNLSTPLDRNISGLGAFFRDRYFFVKYYFVLFIGFLFLDAVLWVYKPLFLNSFSVWHLFFIPLALYAGVLSDIFIHNATHKSFRPLWLNRAVGELISTHQLYGFLGWSIPPYHSSSLP